MAINQNSVGYLKEILKVLSNDKNAIGNQTLVITTSAQSLTPTLGAISAEIQIESTNTIDAVRYWMDGTIPTGSIGIIQSAGAYVELTTAENIKNFKIIAGTGGGTTQINVTYFK